MFEDRQPDVITYQHALFLGGIWFESRLAPSKVKGKVLPVTGHEGPRG